MFLSVDLFYDQNFILFIPVKMHFIELRRLLCFTISPGDSLLTDDSFGDKSFHLDWRLKNDIVLNIVSHRSPNNFSF